VSLAPAGCSGTPLWKKLGIRSGEVVLTVGAPRNYRNLLSGLPKGVTFVTVAEPPVAFIHFFVDLAADLAEQLPPLRADLAPSGILWVSWPKKTSGVSTDITEDTIRAAALPLGLVDVKVCAVDAIWSGLKLIIRKVNRPRGSSGAKRDS